MSKKKFKPRLKRVPSNLTKNEIIALMHDANADSFRAIAAHIEKFEYSLKDVVALLRESADECEAQAIVCGLRDEV